MTAFDWYFVVTGAALMITATIGLGIDQLCIHIDKLTKAVEAANANRA